MKAVFQRALSAHVEVQGQTVGHIGAGALVLLGVEREDTPEKAALMASKIANLRVFTDETGKFSDSLIATGGEALVVSNFTLCANCRHGRRPEFLQAARPEQAEPLYRLFAERLRAEGVRRVETGRFGADMRVFLEGDGPVTILLDTQDWLNGCNL